MKYWIGVDTPQVWEEVEAKSNLRAPHPFGFPRNRRQAVKQIQIGDRIINYITKQKRFFAVWNVTKNYFYDPSHNFAGKIFLPTQLKQAVQSRLAIGDPAWRRRASGRP
jgi:EVE domain